MNNNCPKCNRKLSVLYLKPTCPDCGCNIMSYNMKERLEEDAQKAEAEFAALETLLDKVLPKKIKVFIDRKKNGDEKN